VIASALAAALAPLLALAQPGAAPSALAPGPVEAPSLEGPRPRPDLVAHPVEPHRPGETRCAFCHTAEDWKRVTFAHDRTGFPLTGRHREVTCSACHARGDFSAPLPRACSACHRDVHAQRLGQRCDRCHETTSFRQASFGPDAHRRTNFPLTGRHALIPCQACHGDRRDRDFDRATVRCLGCHEQDYQRTSTDPRLLDHLKAGFSTDCRQCHGPWRFGAAAFPAHEACFSIRSGPHAGVACRDCHTGGIPAFVSGQPLTCSATPAGVPPADCRHCHDASKHPNVGPGGPPTRTDNATCYLCHRFAAAGALRAGGVR
jgi:hypothetical protein